jgi:hypothetical protein
MKHDTAIKEIARQLLEFEFNELNNNPLEYCKSMGWDAIGSHTRRAIKKASSMFVDEKDMMCADKEDILKLSLIITDLFMDDENITTIEISENNKVSNFLVNCVAEHIHR